MGHQRYMTVSQRKARHCGIVEALCYIGLGFGFLTLLFSTYLVERTPFREATVLESYTLIGLSLASILCMLLGIALGLIGPRNVDRRYR